MASATYLIGVDTGGTYTDAAVIEAKGDKKIVIREIPYGTTTESLIASIESAAQKGRVQIAGINDFTTEAVEIELSLPRGAQASPGASCRSCTVRVGKAISAPWRAMISPILSSTSCLTSWYSTQTTVRVNV